MKNLLLLCLLAIALSAPPPPVCPAGSVAGRFWRADGSVYWRCIAVAPQPACKPDDKACICKAFGNAPPMCTDRRRK